MIFRINERGYDGECPYFLWESQCHILLIARLQHIEANHTIGNNKTFLVFLLEANKN